MPAWQTGHMKASKVNYILQVEITNQMEKVAKMNNRTLARNGSEHPALRITTALLTTMDPL